MPVPSVNGQKGRIMQTSAHLRWTDGFQFIARPHSGPALVMDNPDGASGFSPMDMVLMGIAGCTAMDVISVMRKKRQEISRFDVFITGHRANEHPKRYTTIHIEYVFTGTAISPAAAERAIALSTTKYCSAIASVNAELTHSYRIEDR